MVKMMQWPEWKWQKWCNGGNGDGWHDEWNGKGRTDTIVDTMIRGHNGWNGNSRVNTIVATLVKTQSGNNKSRLVLLSTTTVLNYRFTEYFIKGKCFTNIKNKDNHTKIAYIIYFLLDFAC